MGFDCGSNPGQAASTQYTPPDFTINYSKGGTGAGPWQDYLQQGMQLYNANKDASIYGGQRVADMNSLQREGQGMALDIARNGSPDLNAARGQLMATSQGQYLNSNPYLSNEYSDQVIGNNAMNMANAYRLGTGAQTDAAFARQGAFGGSAYAQMEAANAAGLANSVGQMTSQARLGQQGLQSANYQGERANQMTAAGMAPTMANTDYQAAGVIQGVGGENNAYTQRLLDQGYNDWAAQKQQPYNAYDALGNALTRASGGTGAGSTVYQQAPGTNNWLNALGLGLAGAGVVGSWGK